MRFEPVIRAIVVRVLLITSPLFVATPAALAAPAAETVTVRTIKEGTGAPISAEDGVVITYIGRLPDGTVFDSSWGTKPVALLVNQTIPGFAEALMRMREGGHYDIFIPAALAYGANPPDRAIPPNTDITYDVVVIAVVRDAADAVLDKP